ncbi:MAG: hypothetical protein ACR2JU_07660 [Nocardioidaceae bacterium]
MRLLAALLFAAVVAGCGSSQSLTEIAKDPAATRASADPTPHWPKHGCEVHSASAIDYVREPDGRPTPEQAALAYGAGTRGLTAVAVPATPHRERAVLLVNQRHVIVRQMSVTKGSTGWYVDGVEQCSG